MTSCSVCNRANGTLCTDGVHCVEIRPYGKDGSSICFKCMMTSKQSQDEVKTQFTKKIKAASMMTGKAMLTSEEPIPMIGKLP